MLPTKMHEPLAGVFTVSALLPVTRRKSSCRFSTAMRMALFSLPSTNMLQGCPSLTTGKAPSVFLKAMNGSAANAQRQPSKSKKEMLSLFMVFKVLKFIVFQL